jgi:hypothetical protein
MSTYDNASAADARMYAASSPLRRTDAAPISITTSVIERMLADGVIAVAWDDDINEIWFAPANCYCRNYRSTLIKCQQYY